MRASAAARPRALDITRLPGMYEVQSRPWPDIVGFYRGLVEQHGWPIAPMVAFVERLSASPYAGALHGATSHARLLISQHATHAPGEGVLAVEFAPEAQRFTFDYTASAFERPHWHATAAPADGFVKLEHFLRMQRWFVTYDVELPSRPDV